MEKASYTKLGVFVVVTTALLMLLLGLLGAGAFLKHTITIETYFPDTVQGLDKGAAVKMRGVTVGKVSKIELVLGKAVVEGGVTKNVRGYVHVEMAIDSEFYANRDLAKDMAPSVAAGMRARLASSSLMGGGYI